MIRQWILTITVGVILVGTLFILFELREEFRQDQGEVRGTVLWLATEVNREYWRFLDALGRYSLGDEKTDHDELILRLDIFWSQLNTFKSGDLGKRLMEAGQSEKTVEKVEAILVAIEPDLNALKHGDVKTGTALRQRMIDLGPLIHQMAQRIDKSENAYFVGVFNQTEKSLDRLSLLVLFMAGIGSFLIVLLIKEKNRTNLMFKTTKEAERQVREINTLLEQKIRDRTRDLEEEIQERKRNQKALLTSEEKLKETAMTAKVGGWETDLMGNTLSWTDETFRIYEIEDKQLPDVNEAIQYYHPEDRQTVADSVQRAIEKGEAFDFETRLITAKNNQKWVRAIGHAISHQGKNVGLRGMIQDITDRKEVEEKLSESEEKFRSLAENSQDCIMRYDEQCKHLYQNQAGYRISGFKAEEFIGKTHRELGFEPHLAEIWETKIKQVFATSKPTGEIFKWESTEGPVYLDWRVYPEFNKEGKVQSAVGVSRDITKLKQTEEQLKASLKEKETLLHEIHHRVKNNMQVISSLIKLQEKNIDDEQIKDILKDSQNRVYAMAAVHETLHGSDKLSAIDLKFYLQKVATSIFNTFSTGIGKVKLNCTVDDSFIGINQAYPLGLVVNELLSNSMKYAFPDNKNGEISIKMSKIENRLELIIQDDGIGMSNEFDWRNCNTLGLKLVRNLVESQLKGSIDLDRQIGTRYTIKFNLE